jgi:DNA-binding FrmR family transcriptional regulator
MGDYYLLYIPYRGMVINDFRGGRGMIDEKVKAESLKRLKRVEGQVRGVAKMVENEKYCIDIINQLTAAKNALDGVAKIIMKRHVESCVSHAILNGNAEEKIEELITAVYKHGLRK